MMGTTDNREIEANFIHIDVDALKKRLNELGAQDYGEVLLKERIYYIGTDDASNDSVPFVRLRATPTKTTLTYKHRHANTVDGTEEIEFSVEDFDKAELFIDRLGIKLTRMVEKKRHSFELDGVSYDFDTWPTLPTWLQVEGESGEAVKAGVKRIGLNWSDANFKSTGKIIEEDLNFPFEEYRIVTFAGMRTLEDERA